MGAVIKIGMLVDRGEIMTDLYISLPWCVFVTRSYTHVPCGDQGGIYMR